MPKLMHRKLTEIFADDPGTPDDEKLTRDEILDMTAYDVLDYFLDDLVGMVRSKTISEAEYLELDISFGRVMRALMNTEHSHA